MGDALAHGDEPAHDERRAGCAEGALSAFGDRARDLRRRGTLGRVGERGEDGTLGVAELGREHEGHESPPLAFGKASEAGMRRRLARSSAKA